MQKLKSNGKLNKKNKIKVENKKIILTNKNNKNQSINQILIQIKYLFIFFFYKKIFQFAAFIINRKIIHLLRAPVLAQVMMKLMNQKETEFQRKNIKKFVLKEKTKFLINYNNEISKSIIKSSFLIKQIILYLILL